MFRRFSVRALVDTMEALPNVSQKRGIPTKRITNNKRIFLANNFLLHLIFKWINCFSKPVYLLWKTLVFSEQHTSYAVFRERHRWSKTGVIWMIDYQCFKSLIFYYLFCIMFWLIVHDSVTKLELLPAQIFILLFYLD